MLKFSVDEPDLLAGFKFVSWVHIAIANVFKSGSLVWDHHQCYTHE
jgi:hypothetical protein